MRYLFILPFSTKLPEIKENEILVGVDRGALIALKNGYSLDYAIGDFDSVTAEERKFIASKAKNYLKLNCDKDLTDTEYAINCFKDADEILIYGGIAGKRIDHLYANINLCLKYPNVTFIDEATKIMAIPKYISLNEDYYYYSFFASENSIISLKGFKYELEDYKFNHCDNLCISNEAASSNPIVRFKGEGIMIMTVFDSEKE